MGHLRHTFVTRIHAIHHRDPRRVFAAGVWPVVLVPMAVAIIYRSVFFTAFYGGLLAGFACYEALHYRLHFSKPSCRWEDFLRIRHLFHHQESSSACLGITTRFWDRLFGTEPDLEATTVKSLAQIPVLEGPSNLGMLGRGVTRAPGREPK